MKKLMIAACAVAMSAVAQSASLDWGVTAKTWEMADGSTHPNGVPVFLVKNTGDEAWTQFTADLVAGKITSTTIEDSAFWVASDTSYYNADTSKNAFKNGYGKVANNSTAGTPASVDAVGTEKYSIVIFDSQTKGEDTWVMVSAGKDGTSYASNPDLGTPAQFGAAEMKTSPALAWTKVTGDVPEPTSAMLLLLGVAGLALRRRRA